MRGGSAHPSTRPMAGQRGFTYLLALFALAALGLLLAGTGQVWHTAAQRDKEAELLFVGNQFRRAIASYYEQSPGTKQYPPTLEVLLEDPRFPALRRHLRRIYRDPVTGGEEWGLVKVADRIVGLHSLSERTALRTVFAQRDAGLQGATRYDQWVFRYEPPAAQANAAGGAAP